MVPEKFRNLSVAFPEGPARERMRMLADESGTAGYGYKSEPAGATDPEAS
jgi:hypothetical protein